MSDYITAAERLSHPFFRMEIADTTKAFCFGMVMCAAIFVITFVPTGGI